jgi:thymidylate synthase
MEIDLQKEFPILKSKFVAFKTSVKEMLWIYKDQSNDVTKLHEQNVHIWDKWVDENNTIGLAYGYQIGKYKQIDNLINTLKTNPQDRRMIMSMWNIEDLDKMILQPCCFQTLWDVTDGQLNCMLIQRSGDFPIGVPFNTTQYAVLTHLIAQVTNLKVGKLTHIINNCHIYENQIEGVKEQISAYEKLINCKNSDDEELKEVFNSIPQLELDKDVTDFYDFTIDKINLINYKSLKKIKMPVAK